MIAPDANLLIYANSATSPFYRASRAWWEELLSSSEPVGVPIFSLHAFLRFVTNPSIAPKAVTFRDAAATVNSWLALPHVQVIYPGDRHWQILQQLSQEVRLSGKLISDAAIGAVAVEHSAVIHTYDRHFARFPGLRWHNPLA